MLIDIFTILIIIGFFFFWYAEVLLVYSKIKENESLKEYIEAKKRYFESQNEKVVNVEINEKYYENNKGSVNTNNQGENNDFDDITSTNKVNINEEKKKKKSKDDNISNKEGGITQEDK